MGQERAPSFLPTLVKFELRLVQLFGLWIEVDVRRPWLLHVLEHSGLSACRTSLSATTLGVIADTSDVSRDRTAKSDPFSRHLPMSRRRCRKPCSQAWINPHTIVLRRVMPVSVLGAGRLPGTSTW